MGRRKIEIRAIKDDRNRSVTFLKRKGGLFKKAHELSVLCSVEVAVIIFGHNKKLYQFSSHDIGDTLRRYQYCGGPHESKGPADFKNKGGDSEDEDDEVEDGSVKREDSMPPQQQQQQQPPSQQHLMPPNLYANNSFQHVRQPSVTSSPQPDMLSRSNSHDDMRRQIHHVVPMSHPAPPPNNFAYMPNAALYNPNAAVQAAIPPPQPSPQPQYQPFHTPPLPQVHVQMQQAHPQFIHHQRRQSQPVQNLAPPPVPQPRLTPQPEQNHLRPPTNDPIERKAPIPKSQSIFTPIDEGGSVLARHFFGEPNPPARHTPPEALRAPTRTVSQPQAPEQNPPSFTRSVSASEFAAPQRTNTTSSTKSGSISRPKLNLTIPGDPDDTDTSQTSANASALPATEQNGNKMLLPPPSPSASALLSAGPNSGPPNPFARPPPPTTTANTSAYAENRATIETPISALPSRYIDQSMIASPGGMFSEWDNWKMGSAVLPSPLGFGTPDGAKTGIPNLFGRRDSKEEEGKRKAVDEAGTESKRVKT